MEENFEKLVERVINGLEKSDLERIDYYFKNICDNTIVTGVGGSNVVSNYLSKVLGSKNNIICTSLEPRDAAYINLQLYKNIISCSYGGRNYGVDFCFNNDLNKYLFSFGKREGINNITYVVDDEEKSFISLSATLLPMAIALNYYTDGDKNLILEILNDTFCEDIQKDSIFEIMSGYESNTASIYLDSTLTESGIAIPLIHHKYDYCHGRSTTSYNNSNSLIYFNGNKELDFLMLQELEKYYNQIIKIDFKYKDYVVNDFYLTYKSMLLTRKLAEVCNKDLSKVQYSPVVKKLYRYRGEM